MTFDPNQAQSSRMPLRSGNVKSDRTKKWPGEDKKDIGDRIYTLAEELNDVPEETLNRYNNKKDEFIKFDAAAADTWVVNTNARIRRYAEGRDLDE